MKRLLTLVLAAMAFAACTQNDVEELSANRADAPETLTVGFEGGDTRIELNEAVKTVWTEGDEVSVFYKTLTNIRGAFQGKTGDRQGNILLSQTEFGDAVMDEYVVIYPYNEDYLLNAEALTLNAPIPATQSYKEGSYGENGNIMADASDATHVTLRSIYGWLRIHLTGDGEVVESITLRGNNGEQLAGYAQIDLNDYSVRFISESSEPENDMEVGGDLVFEDELITEITLDCGEGVELGAEERVFYIALLPQTFAEGVTIEVNCAGYKPMTLSTDSGITIERNHIKPMAAVEYEPDSEPTTTANQLWYTATALVEPYDATAFNVTIVSNEWDEATGEGIITFDGELTTIGDSAFEDCDSLTSVTIHDSVTTIGDSAFEDCDSLTSVYCEATTPPTLGDYVFWGYDNNWNHVMLDCDIYVPAESVEAYKAAEGWSEYADYIVGYDFETGEEDNFPDDVVMNVVGISAKMRTGGKIWDLTLTEKDAALGEPMTQITVAMKSANIQYITSGTYTTPRPKGIYPGTVNSATGEWSNSVYRHNTSRIEAITSCELTIAIDEATQTAAISGHFVSQQTDDETGRTFDVNVIFEWDGPVQGFLWEDPSAEITNWNSFAITSSFDDCKVITGESAGGNTVEIYLHTLGATKDDALAAGTYPVADWVLETTANYCESQSTKVNGYKITSGSVTVEGSDDNYTVRYELSDGSNTYKGVYTGAL